MTIDQKLRALRKLIKKHGDGVLYKNYEYYKWHKSGYWFKLAYTAPTKYNGQRKTKLFVPPHLLD